MATEPLLDIVARRRPLAEVIAGLKAKEAEVSKRAGLQLCHEAARYGLDMKSYLTLAVDSAGLDGKYDGLNGYEAVLAELNLPIRADFNNGIVLQAASETFQTFPGTRAMFPTVIDDMLHWATRQDQFERTEDLVAVSRPISGPELLFTLVNDDGSEYNTFTVPEAGRVPVMSIRTSEQTVRFYKHGSGIRTTYEFNRRASLDLLTPFASRVARSLALSKVKAATAVLVNGDGSMDTAAPVVAQSSFDPVTDATSANGKIGYLNILRWLVSRAQMGLPVDTIAGNWDAYFQWLLLFNPGTNSTMSAMEALAKTAGVSVDIPRILPERVRFVLSSSVPANKLIGFIKAETLEELKENGSDISEQERNINNQTVTYIRTENTGYRLAMKDTRSIYDFGS